MNNTFFSVIITTYNRPNQLITAIGSVLNQEYKNFEIIIVNDGSTESYDHVLEYIKGNNKIKYFFKNNEERSVARNFAIKKANGKWICFLDDDDIYYPNHLTERYKAIQLEEGIYTLFYSYIVKRFPDNSTDNVVFPQNEFNGIDVLINNLFTINSVCLSSEIAKRNYFNPMLNYWEDFEYWLRIIVKEKLKTKLIRAYTAEYIFHDSNSVSNWSLKLLIDKKTTFEYLERNYSDYLPKIFLTKKFYEIYLGLADCYSKEKNKKLGLQFLLKAMLYKRNFKGIRHVLGVLKNLIQA